jgi:hypothetical protein
MPLSSFIVTRFGNNGGCLRHDLSTDELHIQAISNGPWMPVGRVEPKVSHRVRDLDLIYMAHINSYGLEHARIRAA